MNYSTLHKLAEITHAKEVSPDGTLERLNRRNPMTWALFGFITCKALFLHVVVEPILGFVSSVAIGLRLICYAPCEMLIEMASGLWFIGTKVSIAWRAMTSEWSRRAL
jgi:hypothetical protein